MMIDSDKLRKIRAVYRLSREEVGAMMGVSSRFISYVERGDRKLPEERAERLTRALSLTPEKLARVLAIYEETSIPT